jgi:hypothetical protein
VNGFRSLAQNTTERNVIVWINEYFGRVERAGKTFPDMAAYIENADRFSGPFISPGGTRVFQNLLRRVGWRGWQSASEVC